MTDSLGSDFDAAVRAVMGDLAHEVDALVECRKLNEVNGRIVGQRIGHVRQALALLAGDSPGGSTYGPKGDTARVKLRSATIAQV
jgi:flagella synthesis protein FlgN